jgi:FtsZ-interacting cell division protein ZipA
MGELDTDTIGLIVLMIALAALSVAAKWQRRAGRSDTLAAANTPAATLEGRR